MASFQSASIIAAHLSPVDASKLTGRYETVAKTKSGEDVSVLRCLRHAPQEDLLLQARITPKKVKPVSSDDIDGLCGLFEKKMTVSPKKESPSKSAKNKVGGGTKAAATDTAHTVANASKSVYITKDRVRVAKVSIKASVYVSPLNKRLGDKKGTK